MAQGGPSSCCQRLSPASLRSANTLGVTDRSGGLSGSGVFDASFKVASLRVCDRNMFIVCLVAAVVVVVIAVIVVVCAVPVVVVLTVV